MSVTTATRSGGDLAILGLRLTLGLLFLSVWGSNLNKGLYDPGPYAALIDRYADTGDAPGLWKDVMRFVADNAAVASKLQLMAEVTFGVLLVLGFATRIVAFLAGIFLSTLWLSEINVPNEWIWSLVFPALVAFLLAIVSAGRIRGLDAFLLDRGPLDRLPRWAKG